MVSFQPTSPDDSSDDEKADSSGNLKFISFFFYHNFSQFFFYHKRGAVVKWLKWLAYGAESHRIA